MLMGMVGLDAAAYDIAVETEDGVTIYYNFINEGTELSVTQGNGVVEDFYSNDYSGSVVIPASVSYNDREYDVTAIDDRAFQYCLGLKSITTGSNIKSIGEYAFFGCYDLTTATILDGVTTIGDGAFECCSSLTTVTIPNSVTTIGVSAFQLYFIIKMAPCMLVA